MLNLLSNAGKFQKKGVIQISHNLKRLKEYGNDYVLEIRVADNGIGIDFNEVVNLFQPFWKSEKKRNRLHNPRGNGLGLSICK